MVSDATAPASGKWNLLSVDTEGKPCESSSIETWTIRHNDTQQLRRFLVHIPPSICQRDDPKNDTQKSPILLAFHGYGGGPSHEVMKWKSTCNESKFILVAPQGTMDDKVDKQLSWNAIDCCGSAVSNQVDDMDFVNGVIEILENSKFADVSNVVATGWSNGGFFTSRLGLLQQEERPVWLKAIVPAGGYQYDTSLYKNGVDPLPMFALHGGSDTVVRPGGCCLDPTKGNGNSNCPIKIGSLRDTCLPVQQAFTLWATNINGCKDTIETMVNGTICWEGRHCRATTKLCVWPDEQHMWGSHIPGVEMVGDFLENLRPTNGVVKEKQVVAYESASLWSNTVSAFVVLAAVFVALAGWIGFQRKRNQKDRSSNITDPEEMLELVDTETSNTRTRKAVTRFV